MNLLGVGRANSLDAGERVSRILTSIGALIRRSGSPQRRSTPIPVDGVDKPAWGVVQSVKDDAGDAMCAQS